MGWNTQTQLDVSLLVYNIEARLRDMQSLFYYIWFFINHSQLFHNVSLFILCRGQSFLTISDSFLFCFFNASVTLLFFKFLSFSPYVSLNALSPQLSLSFLFVAPIFAGVTRFYQAIVFFVFSFPPSVSLLSVCLRLPLPPFFISPFMPLHSHHVSPLRSALLVCERIYACMWLVVWLSYIKAAYWEN